jgi:Lrp/AsnC family transcriptional regulator for asnA, asnC and gidA
MKKKIKRLLFELSQNNRITTKKLSKYMKVSQQAASYHIKKLKEKKIIKIYTTIVDPAKLNYMSVLIGINISPFNKSRLKEIIKELKKSDDIITIEQASHGVDLIIEFCVKNLSYFNKEYMDILSKFGNELLTKFTLPVIVKHRYPKSYLIGRMLRQDRVFFGDREQTILSNNEKSILNELIKYPNKNLSQIAKSSNISLKSVIAIKKRLEKELIIRSYGCIFDYNKLLIEKYSVLIKLVNNNPRELNKILEYCRENNNIVEFIKVIGDYNLIMCIEGMEIEDFIKDFRSNFSVENYEVIKIESIEKENYMPLVQ